MGISAESCIGAALFGRVRGRVLALLFVEADRRFYANEVIRLVGSGTGAVQRELTGLAAAGLLTVTWSGRQKYFQANPASPVFHELRGLVLKTAGLSHVLAGALAPLARSLHAAFVYGPLARGEDSASGDVDLLVISDALGYPEMLAAIDRAGRTLGRSVEPRIYDSRTFARRIQEGNAFVSRILEQPKIWIVGGEEELPS
jgi:hypothetical protein